VRTSDISNVDASMASRWTTGSLQKPSSSAEQEKRRLRSPSPDSELLRANRQAQPPDARRVFEGIRAAVVVASNRLMQSFGTKQLPPLPLIRL
jgi:hypothetical protein